VIINSSAAAALSLISPQYDELPAPVVYDASAGSEVLGRRFFALLLIFSPFLIILLSLFS
jgi:hypothetical protein